MIETKDISKSFGATKAVNRLNLNVNAGEIYGLVGSDGAGKTTTLRLLVGALRLDSGRVSICGMDLDSHVEQARAQIGYLSQRFSMYEDLSVLENIRFFAEVRGLAAADWRPRCMEILEFVGLADFIDRPAGLLSGGMKQKLGLASALVTRPNVLLLDEPTTGVDPVTRQDFWQLLVKLVAQPGQVAVIITTPYMDEATRCNRIGFMQKGELIAEGTPSQLRARLNGRILELRGSPLRELNNIAASDPGVEDVRMFGDQLHLRTFHGEAGNVIERLSASIPGSGAKLDAIRQVPANLDDVFILLSEQGAGHSRPVFELPGPHAQALKTLLKLLPPEEFGWVLTGSASLRLQGVDVAVNDLDINCNPKDIRRMEQVLGEWISVPVWVWESEKIRSLDGKAILNGIEVELIADLEVLHPDGIWHKLIDFRQRKWLAWQGLQLPVFPLEFEASAYKVMGRMEKVRLINSVTQGTDEDKHA